MREIRLIKDYRIRASQVALMVKNLPASAGGIRDVGSVPGLGRSSAERNGYPLPVFLPGESHGQRSLVGYSPWGGKESDMTEQLSMHTLLMRIIFLDTCKNTRQHL